MKHTMIHVIAPGDQQEAAALVAAALTRSCGLGPVSLDTLEVAHQALDRQTSGEIWVFIAPRDEWTAVLSGLMTRGHKILLLGALSSSLAGHLHVAVGELSGALVAAASCAPAPTYGTSDSPARIRYQPQAAQRVAGRPAPMADRALRRYDFTDEWNNLGYGAITVDGSPWSLAQQVQVPADKLLARITDGTADLGAYAALWENATSSVMWFNRPVGPIDSQEWRLVEDFVSCHRPDDLPCQPVLAEVPAGYDAAVTMRLDCDEDVESARALWRLYTAEQVPFSLALHAKVLADARHHVLPREVLNAGGAILSHTATHAPDWGGSYEAAFVEGKASADAIRTAIGHTVRYAVSPFHQTPVYARHGLADAGYLGCIGGIIRNDFDFLMARSGMPPHSGAGFIGHSQQCMLHGDCMLAEGDPLRIFRQAFDEAVAAGAFFGYLDHPFSERYQYGWHTEDQRVQAHRDFITHMKRAGKVLFVHEDEAMDFLFARAHVRVDQEGANFRFTLPDSDTPWGLAVRWRGQTHCIDSNGQLA